ncbi:MAG: hypothetical protein WC796_01780 [Candidatus Pacearchaeota archaeon]|jgi:hypothetical protein
MKKGLFTLLLVGIFILLIPLSIAQLTETINNLNINEPLNFNVDKFFKLGESFTTPDSLKFPTQILFGIKGEITLQLLIILSVLWAFFLILIFKILDFIPFFEKKIFRLIATIIITSLIGLSGAIREVSTLFLDFVNVFHIMEQNKFISLLVALALAIVLFAGGIIVINSILNRVDNESTEIKAQKLRNLNSLADAADRSIRKNNN